VDDLARLLSNTPLFAGIDATTAQAVAQRLVRRSFRRGESLFHQGDEGDALYIVVEGAVAVVVSSENGDRMVLTTVHPPDVFGEISLLDGGPRSASAEAVVDTTVLMLSRAAFLELLHDNPSLAEALLRSMGGVIRRLSEQTCDLVFLDLNGRVAKALLRLADEIGAEVDGGAVEIAVTQGRLAEMVGGTRQTVNQILQSFQHRGLLEVQPRGVLIWPDLLRGRAGLGG
jgi:CRP-like cAMP-binding protein